MNIKIFENEYESLAKLILSCFDIKVSVEQLIEVLKENDFRSVIAVKDNEVVGHIMIDEKIDFIKNQKSFFLNYVCVKKDERNQGIGSLLLDYVEKLAENENISTIEFTSGNQRKEAHHLYLKHNYQIKDTSYFVKDI